MKSRHLKQSHHRKSVDTPHESDPTPERETVSFAPRFSRAGFPSAGHVLATRKTVLRRQRADRLAIERGEDEGMPARADWRIPGGADKQGH